MKTASDFLSDKGFSELIGLKIEVNGNVTTFDVLLEDYFKEAITTSEKLESEGYIEIDATIEVADYDDKGHSDKRICNARMDVYAKKSDLDEHSFEN